MAHQRNVTAIGWINVFQQDLSVINRSSERDHSRSENVCRAELVDLDDAKTLHFDHPGLKAQWLKDRQFKISIAADTPCPDTSAMRSAVCPDFTAA